MPKRGQVAEDPYRKHEEDPHTGSVWVTWTVILMYSSYFKLVYHTKMHDMNQLGATSIKPSTGGFTATGGAGAGGAAGSGMGGGVRGELAPGTGHWL